jgi:polyferredoxin
MKITTARRISQAFFFIITVWFCAVTASGTEWWQLRGWPVNWIIELDPLAGLGVLLSTHSVYSGLTWSLVTIVLTIILGRFFCGWVCPFGTLHHFTGYIANRKKSPIKKAEKNSYKSAQNLKYIFLIFLLAAALPDLFTYISDFSADKPAAFWGIVVAVIILIILLSIFEIFTKPKRIIISLFITSAFIALLSVLPRTDRILTSSLQTGLLDPIPLFYRSVNLIFIPLLDGSLFSLSKIPRFYEGAWFIGAFFLAAVLMNLYIPRFYCRFICPLGALFGLLGRYAIWRIGKSEDKCPNCLICEKECEGACKPSANIHTGECVLCMNCLHTCPHDLIGYRTQISASGETAAPDLSKRRLVGSFLSGVIAVPMIRLNGSTTRVQNPQLIRPPGALDEPAFLSRCVKCGQCMKICPTNVIQPALSEAGIEGLWSPVLDFRVGTSGCQLNCIACGHICPTSAIRSLSLDEKTGKNEFASKGPVRIGTAFVDHGRCLPWAMDKPCIVCQENCPVSPKAITTKEAFSFTGRKAVVINSDSSSVETEQAGFMPDSLATGDYYCKIPGSDEKLRLITGNSENSIKISSSLPFKPSPSPGSGIEIYIRLQKPFVDPARCTGCGICEHECPVRSIRAIRVTSDNESRSKRAEMVI